MSPGKNETRVCGYIYIYIYIYIYLLYIWIYIYIYNLYIWISYGVFDWVKSQGNTLYVIIKKFP